jgi:nitrogenase iron protein
MKEKTREGPLELAVYGKGGIGKSTVSANLSAALAMAGKKVLQIGCDPKHDSTRLLTHGELIPTVLDYLRTVPAAEAEVGAVLRSGICGIGCIEAGGPQPGVGCAGRGIITAFEFLEKHRVKAPYDLMVYDVLGDVVCGGFAVPVRREYADAILLVTSGEYMAIYAANNILRGIRNFDGEEHCRVAGILFNRRNLADEEGRVARFAEAVGLPVVAELPRSPGFAHAEEQRRILMELEGYEEEKEVFRSLARRITGDLPLSPARPLTDEELEQTVLGTVSLREKIASPASKAAPEKEKAAPSAPAEKPKLDRPPLYGCAFNGAATTAVHLTDALVIAHSPRACAFYTWQNISSPGRKNLFNRGILMPSAISPHFESSEMDHASAVFGGLDKLRRQVQAALERKPGAVVVISSCVSGIIGDDIRALEALSTPETPVIAIPADGDISGDYVTGIRDCLHILAEKLIDRTAQPEQDCVNLVGEMAISYNNEPNVRALRGLLAGLGLRLNCRFLGDAETSELRGFLKAPLNILDSESADNLELKDFLQREFGCRFLPGHLPVGMEATAAWITELGDFFGCPEKAEALNRRERESCEEALRALRPALAGKTLVLTTINDDMDWIIRAAEGAGMKVAWIGVMNYLRTPLRVSKEKHILEVTEEVSSARRIREQLEKLQPDLVLTNYAGGEAARGSWLSDTVPSSPLAFFRSAMPVLQRWETMFREKERGSVIREKGGAWKNDGIFYEKYFA